MYVTNYEEPGSYAIRDTAIGRRRHKRTVVKTRGALTAASRKSRNAQVALRNIVRSLSARGVSPGKIEEYFRVAMDREKHRISAMAPPLSYGRPGRISGLLGLGQTAGESLIATRLDNLNDKWQDLRGAPWSDYEGLQKNVNELTALRNEVPGLVDAAKSAAILKVLDAGIAKQQKYVDEKISISRAQDRFAEMRNTIKGILAVPAGAALPTAAAPMDIKRLIVPAAITAGVATVVGIVLKKAL